MDLGRYPNGRDGGLSTWSFYPMLRLFAVLAIAAALGACASVSPQASNDSPAMRALLAAPGAIPNSPGCRSTWFSFCKRGSGSN